MMRYLGPGWEGNASGSAWYPQMNDYMRQMMSPYLSGPGSYFWQFQWILCLVTWILVIVLLIALIRWVWKKGDK